jgi:hypothetical protein
MMKIAHGTSLTIHDSGELAILRIWMRLVLWRGELWQADRRFLLDPYALWLDAKHHPDLVGLWPPVHSDDSDSEDAGDVAGEDSVTATEAASAWG